LHVVFVGVRSGTVYLFFDGENPNRRFTDALARSEAESQSAVEYYLEHGEHPVPERWREVFRRVYVREVRRRDRRALND